MVLYTDDVYLLITNTLQNIVHKLVVHRDVHSLIINTPCSTVQCGAQKVEHTIINVDRAIEQFWKH